MARWRACLGAVALYAVMLGATLPWMLTALPAPGGSDQAATCYELTLATGRGEDAGSKGQPAGLYKCPECVLTAFAGVGPEAVLTPAPSRVEAAVLTARPGSSLCAAERLRLRPPATAPPIQA